MCSIISAVIMVTVNASPIFIAEFKVVEPLYLILGMISGTQISSPIVNHTKFKISFLSTQSRTTNINHLLKHLASLILLQRIRILQSESNNQDHYRINPLKFFIAISTTEECKSTTANPVLLVGVVTEPIPMFLSSTLKVAVSMVVDVPFTVRLPLPLHYHQRKLPETELKLPT